MLTGRDYSGKTRAEEYIGRYVQRYFDSLEPDSFTYVDEIYEVLARRIEALRRVGTVSTTYIADHHFINGDYFRNLASGVREVSLINYANVPEIFAHLQALADSICDKSEALVEAITQCETIIAAAEGELKRQLHLNSIKDELLVYDTIGERLEISGGTLAVDRRAGVIILPVTSARKIPISVSITCNRPKGVISPSEAGLRTWDTIENGYFLSRTFGEQPLFETEDDSDITKAIDGDLETSYLLEYNSLNENEDFRVYVSIDFPETKVDLLNLVLDTGGNDAVTSPVTIYPRIARMYLKTARETTDVAPVLLDNRISIRNTTLGDHEDRILHRSPEIFPVSSHLLNRQGLTGIALELACDIPQEIYYLEKLSHDRKGRLIRRLNYFETLVSNQYEPRNGRPDPRSYFSANEIANYIYIDSYSDSTYDERIPLFRYFAAIKEIEALEFAYGKEGHIETDSLNETGRQIAAVELFVNEVIPPGCSITYAISANRTEWYPIEPSSRTVVSETPKRITFSGFENIRTDFPVDIECRDLYLRINMTGDGVSTPVVKSYALRIKLI